MAKFNMKHITRTSGLKAFMKSQRKKKVNISVDFLEGIRRYTHKLVVDLSTDAKESGVDLDKWSANIFKTKKPKPGSRALLSRTEIDLLVKKLKVKMSTDFFKGLDSHIVYVCSASVVGTKETTVRDLVTDVKKVVVTDSHYSNPDSRKPITEDEIEIASGDEIPVVEVGVKNSYKIGYSVQVQGVEFDGTFYLKTGYKKKKIEQSVTNAIVNRLKQAGINGEPVVSINEIVGVQN